MKVRGSKPKNEPWYRYFVSMTIFNEESHVSKDAWAVVIVGMEIKKADDVFELIEKIRAIPELKLTKDDIIMPINFQLLASRRKS